MRVKLGRTTRLRVGRAYANEPTAAPSRTYPLTMSLLVLNLRILLVRLGFAVGRLMPRRRRVVLATSHVDRISGNLAFIHDDLRRRYPGVPVTTLAYRPAATALGKVRMAAKAVIGGFHLATAAVFVVDDYYMPMYVIQPRPGTIRAQVWHACGAFKKFGYSILDKEFGFDRRAAERVRIHGNYDVCLVSSRAVASHYAEAFRQPVELFRGDLGIPRTDAFFASDRPRIEAEIRTRYGLPEGRRVILYAPTFRGTTIAAAQHPAELDIAELQGVLGDDHVLLIRLHPFVRAALRLAPETAGFAIDVSGYPDINELMLVSDVLVTDYSSAMFEFGLLGRPMVFFAPDHDAYIDERGFYFEYRSGVPGPVFETTEELAAYLRAGSFDLERIALFRAASFDVADGHATERFVDRIVIPALRGERPA